MSGASQSAPRPKRGEVWDVQFAPSVGAEIRKVRPALVLSRDDVGKLPLRVVVPLTTWQESFVDVPWMIEVTSSTRNGLDHQSVADCFQPRSFATERFIAKRGTLNQTEVERIARTVAEVLGVGFD